MTRNVVIVGALDTKGAEFAFLKDLIERPGVSTLSVDVGVLGEPAWAPDVSHEEVAQAAGADLSRLRSGDHKDEAMKAMAAGAAVVVRRLHEQGRLHGIIGMGGSGGTSVATAAMRELPIGVPKVMVSTVGGGDVSGYAGTKDILFMPSIVDVAGINRISRAVFANAAGAIAGMVQGDPVLSAEDRPLVTASMFGNTTPCVDRAREVIERAGFEVLVFHATGIGGRTMEGLISDGYVSACLDVTTTELADTVCGGVFDAGPERALAAPRAGIPTVLAPGCVDMANFGGPQTVPERYRRRTLYEWNPDVTLLRTDHDENVRIGELLAAAANASSGPTAVLLPLRGVSMLDSPGGPFWDPDADGACFDAIRKHLGQHAQLIELDSNVNDPEFADAAAQTLLELLTVPDPEKGRGEKGR